MVLTLPGLEKEQLWTCYPEFIPYEKNCRFIGCSHINEPDWRRDKALSSVMKSKNSEYHTYTIIVLGFEKIGLMDEIRCFDSFFGNICGIVYSVVHSQSGGVEQTCIKARVPFDLEEMTYVDE